MIYSPSALLPEIRNGKIVRNLSERELKEPEGVGFDLCLASVVAIGAGTGSLRLETRRTPSSAPLQAQNDTFVLAPGRSYLASTREEFDLPAELAAVFYPRSTLFRSGVIFQSSILPPGYVGPMTFSLFNSHTEPFEIEQGSRFAHVIFHAVEGDVAKYRGQWQGGRISQPHDEGQV